MSSQGYAWYNSDTSLTIPRPIISPSLPPSLLPFLFSHVLP